MKIILNNGVEMPIIGYGVYQIPKSECKQCVLDALSVGYRMIDTAQSYFNEEEVGKAIKESKIPREEIFITTKVWIEHYEYEDCIKSVLKSMEKLQVDYIDLVLLHQPFNNYYAAYKALEYLYKAGKIHAIGVSNFSSDRFVDLQAFVEIKPMINQIEINPLNQQKDAKKWLDKYNCCTEAWAPFGEGRCDLFNNPVIKKIAITKNKTVAQVILRWLIQRNIVVIPKTTHIERMKENIDIFDFNLLEDEMNVISELDTSQSLFFSHQDPEMVEWFIRMIEERRGKN